MMVQYGEQPKTRLLVKGVVKFDLCPKRAGEMCRSEQCFTFVWHREVRKCLSRFLLHEATPHKVLCDDTLKRHHLAATSESATRKSLAQPSIPLAENTVGVVPFGAHCAKLMGKGMLW